MLIVFLKKEQRQTGSIIKSLEKETEWTLQINKSVYTITFCYSEVDNWKTLKINQLQMYKQKIPKELIQHAFIIENIDFNVKYDKVTKAFLLLVFGNPVETCTVEASMNQNLQQELMQKQLQSQNQMGQQEKLIQQQQKQIQMNNIKQLEERIDRSLPIMNQLVELFKGVIDNCQSNEDVINSEDLRKLKEDILVDQGKLTNVLNQEICEASTDKVLKMIDKQVQSTNRFDDICSRKIILAMNQQQLSHYDSIKSKIEQYNNDKKKPQEKDNELLVLPNDSDDDNDDVKEYNSKRANEQKQESNPPWNGGNQQGYGESQQLKQMNYQYPIQTESQVLFYQKQNVQLQQQQQQLQPQYPEGDSNNNNYQQSQKDKIIALKAPAASEPNKDDNLCIICMDQPSTHTLVPCGHKKYCEECANLMVKNKQCAFCRNSAVQCLRIFE